MAEYKYNINTPAGQTVERKQYKVYGNTGTYESPEWHVIGRRVEDSGAENDWGGETINDVVGDTYSTAQTPITTQSFDSCPIDAGDAYQAKLVQLSVVERNAQALANQDLLRVHLYLTDSEGNAFAERFPSSMVLPSGPAGAGGGSLTMPVEITFGGERETGSVKPPATNSGTVVFTPDASPVVLATSGSKVAVPSATSSSKS